MNDRLRKNHSFQDHGLVFITDRMPGQGTLESYDGTDISGIDLLDLFTLVRVHFEQPADTFPGPFGRVIDIGTGCQRPGIDPDKRQLSNEGVGHNLERYACKRFAVGSTASYFLSLGANARSEE